MRHFFLSSVALLSVFLGQGNAQDVIFDNTANSTNPICCGYAVGLYPGSSTVYIDAFPFTVQGASYRLDRVGLLATINQSVGPAPSGLSLFIYADSDGKPGEILESWGAVPIDGGIELRVVSSSSHPLLEQGKQYWFGVTTTNPLETAVWWINPALTPTMLCGFANGVLSSCTPLAAGAFKILGTIDNGCTASSIAPKSAPFSSTGGSGTLMIGVNGGCVWEANTPDSWITLSSSPLSGTGSAVVKYAIAPNASSNPRTGNIIVAGHVHYINQAGVGSCTFSLSPTSQVHSEAGGTGTVEVVAPPGCQWSAASPVPWITITQGSSGSGSGSVRYFVQQNTALPRQATLTVADKVFLVRQTAYGCGAVDVTGQVKVNRGPILESFINPLAATQEIYITNIGRTTIPGPLHIVMDGLPRTSGSMSCSVAANLTGLIGLTYCGSPNGSVLVRLDSSELRPGQSVRKAMALGGNSYSCDWSYVPRIFSGTPNQ